MDLARVVGYRQVSAERDSGPTVATLEEAYEKAGEPTA